MSTITVNLADAASIDRAIEELNRIAEEIRTSKCEEFCRRLAEIGVDVTNTVYSAAPYAGTNDVSVKLEQRGNGYAIMASGSALGFIEFGTGRDFPLGEYANQVGAPPHGTYGQRRGAKPPWLYKGDPGTMGTPSSSRPGLVWTSGNPPANAFPQAVNEIKAQIEAIAREVFVFD